MRTFVAVEISNESILESIREFQTKIKIKAKPVDTKNMHFTLMFLGEISDSVSHKVKDALKKIEFSPFELSFEGIGAFPKPRFPRVVWVGCDKMGAQNMIDLAAKVQNALLPLGFSNDKPFKPHMTIFRIKTKIGDITDELTRYNEIKFGKQVISEIKFKESVLTSDGPIYSDLEVFSAR